MQNIDNPDVRKIEFYKELKSLVSDVVTYFKEVDKVGFDRIFYSLKAMGKGYLSFYLGECVIRPEVMNLYAVNDYLVASKVDDSGCVMDELVYVPRSPRSNYSIKEYFLLKDRCDLSHDDLQVRVRKYENNMSDTGLTIDNSFMSTHIFTEFERMRCLMMRGSSYGFPIHSLIVTPEIGSVCEEMGITEGINIVLISPDVILNNINCDSVRILLNIPDSTGTIIIG